MLLVQHMGFTTEALDKAAFYFNMYVTNNISDRVKKGLSLDSASRLFIKSEKRTFKR